MPSDVRPLALRPAAAARALSIHRSTLYRMEEQERIVMSRDGGITWVPMSEIERLLNQRPAKSEKPTDDDDAKRGAPKRRKKTG